MLLLAAIAGCGGGRDTTGTGGTMGGGGTSGAACPTSSATGTLSVRFSGLPSGGGTVTLPLGGIDPIRSDADVPLPAGAQEVLAFEMAEPGTPIRTAYAPTITYQTVCVRAGQTTILDVRYELIPTSGRLWVGASNTPSASTMLGYGPGSIAATGSVLASILADTGGADGFTFDPFGNIWVTGGTTADAPLARYPRAVFTTSGVKVPDLVIDSPSFGSSLPGPKVVAFDGQWRMWVSVVAENKLVMFEPLQAGQALETGVTHPVAAVERMGISAPAGIAFSSADNLWVAANGASTVMRIDSDHKLSSGSGADLTITAMTPPPVIGTLSDPLGIAFDFDENLWVNYGGTIARLAYADLQGSGTKTITPAIQIITDVLSTPIGLAFDEEGGLWLAYSAGKFARLAPSQLTASGVVTPQIVITSADLGYAGWFAIYPAPVDSWLAHWLP
jgi:sugar lactone lactonase YvrE